MARANDASSDSDGGVTVEITLVGYNTILHLSS